MLISEKRKFIFVEVPKTGTSTICASLLELDADVIRNKLPNDQNLWVDVDTHITCAKIEKIMGQRFYEFSTICFFRDPVDLIISKYFFYRQGRASKRVKKGGAPFMLRLRTLLAQITPLWIWCFIYPFKAGSWFILDDNRRLLVQEIGDFEKLEEEFPRIFSEFGYPKESLRLKLVNKSIYERPGWFTIWACSWSARLKLKSDYKIYSNIMSRRR